VAWASIIIPKDILPLKIPEDVKENASVKINNMIKKLFVLSIS
jgi:hypothetical protein